MFSGLLNNLIQSLSEWFFNVAHALFNSINNLTKLKWEEEIHLLIIIPFLLLITIKVISLAKKDIKMKDYYLKNKYILRTILVLCVLSFSQNQIISFVVNSFDSLFDPASIVEILRNDLTMGDVYLSISIVNLFSAVSATLIALSEVLSILSLKITLVLLPLIAFLGFYNPVLSVSVLKQVTYGIAYPVIQTFVMYITITQFLPLITSNPTILSNTLIKTILILSSFHFAKIIADGLFIEKEKEPLQQANLKARRYIEKFR